MDPAQFFSNPWAAKNFMTQSGLMMPSMMSRTSSPEKTISENMYEDTEKNVTVDGVEVGEKETALVQVLSYHKMGENKKEILS